MDDKGSNHGLDELDYILQVISNRIRRKVIKLLAEKGPLSYTDLMKEVGIEDSGTFGFHIRKMKMLITKDEWGKYKLNELGYRAYEIIKDLEEGLLKEAPSEVESKELEVTVISDKVSFELTRELAESLKRKGKRLIIGDIMKLIIHPMPRELFDEIVESIYDCLTVYAPSQLVDLVSLKSKDVISIKSYEGKPPKESKVIALFGINKLIPDIDKAISKIIKNIINPVVEAAVKVSKVATSKKYTSGELILDQELNIPNNADLSVSVSGGSINISEGNEDRIKVWSINGEEPDVDLDISNNKINLDVSKGKCNLKIRRSHIKNLDLEVNGGVLDIDLSNISRLSLDLNGGMTKLNLSSNECVDYDINISGGILEFDSYLKYMDGESNISLNIDGGGSTVRIKIPDDVKIAVKSEVYGGLLNVKLNGAEIPSYYIEPGFKDSRSKLRLNVELVGGLVSVEFYKSKED